MTPDVANLHQHTSSVQAYVQEVYTDEFADCPGFPAEVEDCTEEQLAEVQRYVDALYDV